MPASAGRIELRGELARGGIGAILRGHDPALNREVAVKVLLASLTGRPDLVRRFVEEAQVAGQLQHPGVVPVYDLGALRRRPAVLRDEARPGPHARRVAGRAADPVARSAAVLEDFRAGLPGDGLCPFAAVIHRDLKPLNVMVGEFGEVQVMDWGMAKVLTLVVIGS